ncbi:hypothetical protein Q4566_06760 [Tamlana sp. 2_MG-2023]|uniref:tetratricopeptide repeat protein n=1 Tax=unclassified Tamlana TaxID=2614803 RepID=UPI0026E27D3B|nr:MULTISPECIES: tetratricopeptide repeat protein [unclassified Tamlana]MDO6759897.1 hypothetical protein [Tamlana sp. 2_MG-2023]MDO6791933.1 hypothetical protein [Tamlana sp. 1_MG-2023]
MQDENYILFESYLSEMLSTDEILAFESRLKVEPELNQAFQTYKELSGFLEHKFENEEASKVFQEHLNKISEAHFNKVKSITETKGTTKIHPILKYLVAASIVVLFGIFTYNQFSTPSFSDYNNYETISLTVRSGQDKLLKIAENAFNAKDFAKAEEAFSKLINEDKNNAELKLYRAISNLELDHFEIADGLLEELRTGNSAFKNKAIWYLGLSKLKQKDYNAALVILKSIPEDADDFKQAQKLIDKLD